MLTKNTMLFSRFSFECKKKLPVNFLNTQTGDSQWRGSLNGSGLVDKQAA